MTEKRKPSHALPAVQAVLGDVKSLAITRTALEDAVALGFDRTMIAAAIRSLTREMFYKSMTTFADHRVWQDVYHLPLGDGQVLYVKFQSNVVTEFMLMSFKEKS